MVGASGSGVGQPRPLVAAVAACVFVFLWLFRFNDPGGSFAGLTDDHFFYLVRGWQILYGELPVRDFVDHGAPLYYYVAAAVQQLFGRGTLSELVFSVSMIALGGALTFWLAARASGSVLLGLLAALIQAWLAPRFYNYPKILVYAAAIPLLWWFADRPGARPRFWLAATTAVAFLLRHDHGVIVAISAIALFLAMQLPWTARLRHAASYVALTAIMLVPYLAFVQLNGGLSSYVSQASAWAARERDRAPVVWPGLFDYPDGVSDATSSGWMLVRAVGAIRDNTVAWWYYLELLLPFLALAVVLMSANAFRPAWPRARTKILLVVLLGVLLNIWFLRSPLSARLADPSVPHVILVAWLATAISSMFRHLNAGMSSRAAVRTPIAVVLGLCAAAVAFVMASTITRDAHERLDSAALAGGIGGAFERVAHVSRTVETDWDLSSWTQRDDRPELITLAMYLNRCTSPDARVFVQPYIPQVLALARRGFAGGHADLRPGFFTTDAAQRLTLERMGRQHVPVALLETGDSYENFRESFPLIAAHFDRDYAVAGMHEFDSRFGITLLVNRREQPRGDFPELGWPCFA